MLELPEVLNISRQLRKSVVNKKVIEVLPPTKLHKFCWFNGDVAEYAPQITGARITDVSGFGLFVEMAFDNGRKLCINDGVNVRLSDVTPKDFQLLVKTEDDRLLVFTVAMYGGIVLYDGNYDNDYYLKSRKAISPFDAGFEDYFHETFTKSKQTLSAKAFMATEQRFPGIGNGVLQDILFTARIHPKRKIGSLSDVEKQELLRSTIDVLGQMTSSGGRDTEKDIYGETCGYETLLSKNTVASPCPRCGATIVKEPYLGGAVYYCPECQQAK